MLQLPPEQGGHQVDLDDWMYLIDDDTLMNRAEIRRFGIRFADITITFRRCGSTRTAALAEFVDDPVIRAILAYTSCVNSTHIPEAAMNEHVYKKIEITGSSAESSDHAIRNAISKASKTVKNMEWFEVVDTRGWIKDGHVAHWQVTIKLGFRLED